MQTIFKNIIDETKLYDFVRSVRWEQKVYCPRCQSHYIRYVSRNRDNFKYYCNACKVHFNDLTGTIFAHTRIPLWKWIMAIYLLSLGHSNQRIGKEVGVNKNTQDRICAKIRSSIWNISTEKLSGIIEADEVYQNVGEKGTKQVNRSPRKRAKKNEAVVLGILISHLLWEQYKGKQKANQPSSV